MWTTSKGDPEYSGQKKPKRTFPFEFWPKFPESLDAFYYAKLTGQRSVGIPEENGTTFSD